MVPERQAAGIAKISRRKLRYWEEIGLVIPSVSYPLGRRKVRLYTLDEVLQLSVAGWLRDTLSLQQIRKIVRQQGMAYDSPLSVLRFAEYKGEIYFQHPDGTWEAGKPKGQGVIAEAIPLRRFRRRIDAATRRPSGFRGRIEKRRGALGSKPVFAGTRIPVTAVEAYLRRGYSTADILDEYPGLAREDVDAARERLAG
jgi:uncharacterized protein (DUF433 family)/DNA-binding transcriptional MerR regulator